ncbi:MAG: MoxR family ATPase [Oscillospiraceae bacterium]|nr:MoxR family ATPase [Oscillospiraceae bacterium]
MEINEIKAIGDRLCENIERVIIGKTGEIRLILAALLAGGHVLLEDVPGTGKTILAKALARSVDIGFRRVQFTPDLLPSELTGLNVYSPKTGDFSFRHGSLFTNILLADEINRASPRTQSGLLESMEERQVSVDGKTYVLPAPYFVIATQNPVETQGTFPLPEAQLDRFLVQLKLGYPDENETVDVLKRYVGGDEPDSPLASLKPICGEEAMLSAINAVRSVYVHDEVFRYIVRLAEATRSHEGVALGVSTRGCVSLARIAQAYVALAGRAFATPDDIKALTPPVFTHRLILRGGRQSFQAQKVLDDVLNAVVPPVEDWPTAQQADN